DADKYKDDTRMKIKVLSDGREITGDFSIVSIDGQSYGKIQLNRYMSTYVKDRFLELQIVEEQIEGLKIPKTSVVEKEFYTIPVEYMGRGGDSSDMGFFKKTYDENQNESIVFVTPTIYKATDEFYYIDTSDESVLKEGDFVVMADSSDSYRIGAREALKGVYNVNNGYCVFRNISILTETGEYYLVDTETSYGLKVYDHIVIDGSMVKENQVVFSVN
ncbi:MAG: HlyD family efflux transporter periplasmic adaptor subunit, partial [Lachnospiraceae bacterium]